MKIIYNNIIPFKGFKGINLFGILFARKEFKDKLLKVDLRHAEIHTALIKELWYIGFYFLYLWYWLKGLILFGVKDYEAYHSIPFEREAYHKEKCTKYLENRPKFAWTDYRF